MQIANCSCAIDGFKSDVQKLNTTPAEVLILREMFTAAANGDPVLDLSIKGEVTRTEMEEKQRLMELYGGARMSDGTSLVEKIFPGASPKMPLKFAEVGLGPKEVEKPTPSAKPATKEA